ncbi:hypothetical protein [Massiliimalia timonensis]|nr:hypothetical protein [Massiliimalia timonensis]MBS7175494.1 hypothetical protein [Clostridiales bacterium]
MAKKVMGYISFGVSLLIFLCYLMSTFMAYGSDSTALLILAGIMLPFYVLGLLGCIFADRLKVMSGIFMILAGGCAVFTGLMTLAGGLEVLGILALPLGVIDALLYLVAAILTFVSKTTSSTQ